MTWDDLEPGDTVIPCRFITDYWPWRVLEKGRDEHNVLCATTFCLGTGRVSSVELGLARFNRDVVVLRSQENVNK